LDLSIASWKVNNIQGQEVRFHFLSAVTLGHVTSHSQKEEDTDSPSHFKGIAKE
jgi:hypothetical protein